MKGTKRSRQEGTGGGKCWERERGMGTKRGKERLGPEIEETRMGIVREIIIRERKR